MWTAGSRAGRGGKRRKYFLGKALGTERWCVHLLWHPFCAERSYCGRGVWVLRGRAARCRCGERSVPVKEQAAATVSWSRSPCQRSGRLPRVVCLVLLLFVMGCPGDGHGRVGGGQGPDDDQPVAIPEPSAFLLLLLGVSLVVASRLGVRRWRATADAEPSPLRRFPNSRPGGLGMASTGQEGEGPAFDALELLARRGRAPGENAPVGASLRHKSC
jgi:hypothetical protein